MLRSKHLNILHSSTEEKKKFQLEFDIVWTNNLRNMNLKCESNLQMSIISGLIEGSGASCYLNNRPNPLNANRTLICHVKSHEEHLNFIAYIKQLILLRCGSLNALFQSVPNVTRVVVGIGLHINGFSTPLKRQKLNPCPSPSFFFH